MGALTFGSGNGGNIDLKAQNLEVRGISPGGPLTSALITSTTASGNSRNIDVRVSNLKINNGGSVLATSGASGNAGNLSIFAEAIALDGLASSTNSQNLTVNYSSRISVAAGIGAEESYLVQAFLVPEITTGNSGELIIKTHSLSLNNGASISAFNIGGGNAGILSIDVDTLTLENGGEIEAFAASGSGGSITVNSDTISLLKNSGILASAVQGQGGNIQINTDSLRLLNDSGISATAGGAGDGGNITINADTISLFNNSGILANAFQGRGGNIQINTDALLQSPDTNISATSELGIDGEVTINTPESTLEEEIQQRQTELNSTDQLLAQSCLTQRNAQRGRFTYTGRGGQRVRPGFRIDEGDQLGVPPIAQETSQVEEQPEEAVPVGANWQPGDPIVEGSRGVRTADGRVFLVASSEVQGVNEMTCRVEE